MRLPFTCLFALPLFCGFTWAQPGSTEAAAVPAAEKPSFPLLVGQQYEKLGEWERAEEQYLKVGQDGDTTIQQQALAGIERVRQQLTMERRENALEAAREMESQRRWKEAEQQYLDLLKSDSEAKEKAADGLQRLRPKVPGERWPEAFDELAAKIGRVFLLVLVLPFVIWSVIHSILEKRKTIQFLPFRASNEEAAKRLAFWCAHVRADLRSTAPALPLSPRLESSLPFVRLPDLPEQLAEPAELEVGGAKLPLKQLVQLAGLARVRISGSWLVESGTGHAYAEIERRRRLSFHLHSTSKRSIPSAPGSSQEHALQLFVYDVFIKAGRAYEP